MSLLDFLITQIFPFVFVAILLEVIFMFVDQCWFVSLKQVSELRFHIAVASTHVQPLGYGSDKSRSGAALSAFAHALCLDSYDVILFLFVFNRQCGFFDLNV